MTASELGEPARNEFIRTACRLLDLISFLTAGPDECRGSSAPKAAGKVHSDFERGFIRCEVVRFGDLTESGSMAEARRRGLLRQEGKSYAVQNGDVLNILFSV